MNLDQHQSTDTESEVKSTDTEVKPTSSNHMSYEEWREAKLKSRSKFI